MEINWQLNKRQQKLRPIGSKVNSILGFLHSFILAFKMENKIIAETERIEVKLMK